MLCSGTAQANPFEDTVRILEDRTAFHWGRDCFVWVVHYSESLVDPWVEAEAGRMGMTDSEREAYKAGFVSDLSIGESEALLVTVHAFGVRPLNLAQFSDKIALVTPDGQRIKPTKYDQVFDQPLNGVVQGLVFFPKQSDQGFALAIAGLGVFEERIFAFSGEAQDFSQSPQENGDEPEIIVVELPPAPKEPPPTPNPRPRPARPQPPMVQPQPPSPPPAPPQPPVPVPVTAAPEPTPPEPTRSEPEIVVVEPEGQSQEEGGDVAYSSREHTLRGFLDLWAKSDHEGMYAMLADSSRKLFSAEEFEAELKKNSDFRNTMRDGYTIDWTGPEQAKVVAIKRFLFIRTLLSRSLGVTREDAAWKIVW